MGKAQTSKYFFSDFKISKAGVIFAAIIDVLANIVGIVTAIYGDKKIGVIIIIIAVATLLLVLAAIAINFFRAGKAIRLYRHKSFEKQTIITSDLHHILHSIRNITQSLANNTYTTDEELKKSFEKDERELCTKIEEMYKTLFDRTTSVCIKMLRADDLASEDYKSWQITTFARGFNSSGGIKGDRGKNDHKMISVEKNSDFLIIIEDIVDYFVSEDMSNIRQKFQESYQKSYLNSREDNEKNNREKEKFSDFYNSTIVIPIRIESRFLGDSDSNLAKYHLLGFFCVDTKTAFVTEEELDKFYIGVEYAKAIADTLYNQISVYLSRIIDLRLKAQKAKQDIKSTKINEVEQQRTTNASTTLQNSETLQKTESVPNLVST